MLKDVLGKLTMPKDLSYEEAFYAMNRIMDGLVSNVQIGAFLTGLAVKGETVAEITGCAQAMRNHALEVVHNLDVFEISGTGGDKAKTFNISTTAAFVIAAGGVLTARHGNRAKSSKSGSADVLEALGANILLEPVQCLHMLERIGLCYFFTRHYYTAMQYIDPVRQELGIKTVFDVLRPLTNPAHAKYEVLGVYDEALVEPMAHVLANMGVVRGMVVYGQDGGDEISAAAPTTVCEFHEHEFNTYEIRPEDFLMHRCLPEEVAGGTPQRNAAIATDVLSGEKGPKRNSVLLNAGAGLYIAGKALTMAAGVKMAADLIDSGEAMEKLKQFIDLSNSIA